MKRTLTILVALSLGGAMVSGCSLWNKMRGKVPSKEQIKDDVTPDRDEVLDGLGDAGKAAKKAIDEVDRWSDRDERAMGDGIALALSFENGEVVDDPRLTKYVNDVANVVGMQGKRVENKGKRGQDRRFVVGVINSREINAFAAPGGFIFITRGLMMQLRNEAELAFVLAHEIAHVDNEDALTFIKIQLGTAGGAKEFVSSMTKGASELPLLDQPRAYAFLGDQVVKAMSALGYGKKKEYAADAAAVEMLKKAGYDPRSAGFVLQRLAKANEAQKKKLGKTHPEAMDRFNQLKPAMQGGKGNRNGDRFAAVVITQLSRKKKKPSK